MVNEGGVEEQLCMGKEEVAGVVHACCDGGNKLPGCWRS